MKRQKIINEVRREVMTVAAGALRDAQVDLILETYGLAQDETALKAICRSVSGCKYW